MAQRPVTAFDTQFNSTAWQLLQTLHGEAVTYTIKPTEPGAADVASAITVVAEHLPDLSPATARPHQRRKFWIDSTDITLPKRGDQITDAGGSVWSIFDVIRPVGGVVGVFARIGQVRG